MIGLFILVGSQMEGKKAIISCCAFHHCADWASLLSFLLSSPFAPVPYTPSIAGADLPPVFTYNFCLVLYHYILNSTTIGDAFSEN